MLMLPILAAFTASFGWATGIILAEKPAQYLGTFEFTKIQLITCSAILAAFCTYFGYWETVDWSYWPSFVLSASIGIIFGNLAMIECLRRGGPGLTEVLLTLKAPLTATMAYIFMQEVLVQMDLIGSAVTLSGVILAIYFSNNPISVQSHLKKQDLLPILLLGAVAAACQGYGFLVLKPVLLAGTEPLAASAIRLLGAAFILSLFSVLPVNRSKSRCKITPTLLGQTILPGFIGYGISSTLLLYAFANLDAGIAATLGSLSPVLVLLIIWFKDGFVPHPYAISGSGLAALGTVVIVLW